MICQKGEVIKKVAARRTKDNHKCTFKLSAQGSQNLTTRTVTCNPKLEIFRPSMDQVPPHLYRIVVTAILSEKGNVNERLLHRMNFQWTTQFKILDVYLDVDLTKGPALNYDKKLVKKKLFCNEVNDILPLWVGFH